MSIQLAATTPKSKTADQLIGLTVKLQADHCRCGSDTAIIDADHRLVCRSCSRPRGWLSKSTASWIAEVVQRVGAQAVIFRGPAL